MQYRLRSRAKFPPQSWKYFQPQTGWKVPDGLNFNQAVEAIVKHRVANKLNEKGVAIDAGLVASELDAFTCKRLGFNPHWVQEVADDKKKDVIPTPSSEATDPPSTPQIQETPLPEPIPSVPTSPDPPPPPIPPSQPERRVVPLVEKLKQSVSGLKTLTEWLGDGGFPVEQEVADPRSAVCLPCPMNVKSEGFDGFTKAVASAIKRHLKVKDKVGLTVPNEEGLGTCEACGCATALKVWVPIDRIRENITDEQGLLLADQCWIRKELGIQ